MIRKFIWFLVGTLLLTATSCEHKSSRSLPSPVMGMQESYTAGLYIPPSQDKTPSASGAGGLPQRYIAERHELDVITPESELQKAFESGVAFCGTLQCEIISSNFTAKTSDSMPSGTMSLRVVPSDLEKLLAHIPKLGKIAQHTTEREDKTATVIDTDAKLKNLTAFRDNLRAMLAKPSATVKDLIEIQQQLSETQSQLDSEAAERKVLANETEKIAVAISFRVKEAGPTARGFNHILEALRESGSVFADSMAFLITVIVAVIPWLIVIVPLLWFLAKAWRKLRRNRVGSPSPSKATP